jgi:hypothetical protein
LSFELKYTLEAHQQYSDLSRAKHLTTQFKAVRKALRLLQENPAHPSLKTHKYDSLIGPGKTEVFEAYAQNNTPGAWRIFWCYHPPKKQNQETSALSVQRKKQLPPTATKKPSSATTQEEIPATITVLAITPHP